MGGVEGGRGRGGGMELRRDPGVTRREVWEGDKAVSEAWL